MISGLIALMGFAIGVFLFIFWIWMLIDCIKNDRLSSTEKIVWVLVIVFLHAMGALIYLLAGRRS
jgi:Phospholipase_D-nuclease N-terminal